MTHSRLFRYQKITFEVTSEDRNDLLWLAEFVGPQFSTVRHVEHDCAIILQCAPETFQELKDRGPRTDLEPQEGFAQDTKTELMPVYVSEGETLTVFDGNLGVFYARDRHAKSLTILHDGNNPWQARFAIMRVIRELAMTHMIRLGQPLLHASAFARGKTGFVMSGPKRAGKTSLLTHCLQHGEHKYISNDRAFADIGRSNVYVTGLPTILTLRESALVRYPALEDSIRKGGYQYTLRSAEAKRRILGPSEVDPYGRFNLSPRHYCDLMGVRSQARARLGAYLFPRVEADAKRIEVTQLDPSEVAPKIKAGLFRAEFPTQACDFFAMSDDNKIEGNGELEEAIHQLAKRVPAFQCLIGPDAYHDYDWLDGILKSIDAD